MFEKRKFRRLNMNFPVTIRYKGEFIPARALNISCGGICITSPNTGVELDGAFEIFFDLDSKHKDIALRAEILHTDGDGDGKMLGVRFVNPFSKKHVELQDYLTHQLSGL